MKSFSRVISWFKGDETALTLAKVLAEVDMISFDLLEQLYEEDYPKIEQLVNNFESLSILDFYGPEAIILVWTVAFQIIYVEVN